jgi:uncharacterized repeat protein (TIGR03803 family)
MGSGGTAFGDIFRLKTDGSGFTVLASLTGFNGTAPSSLVFFGSQLYGTTFQGGQFNAGVVFMLSPGGGPIIPLKQFQNFDGFFPRGLAPADTVLFGVTGSGGSNNCGTIFGLSLLPPAILQPPSSQTVEAGGAVKFLTKAEGAAPLGYKWLFAGDNVLNAGTNAFLKLTNVQPAQAGDYSVVVTNLFGSVTSPAAQLSVIAPVIRTAVPGINVQGETGSVVHVDCANDLSFVPDWLPLGLVSLTSTSQFYFDLTMPLPSRRFYRAWLTGTPDISPTLTLYQIPAITLTGNPGETVRVDGINAVGPTDAWFTIATVTLTNTLQYYFDVTALSQPPRLYRLIQNP